MKNKNLAIITGGARGIGIAISKQLIADGYTVVICSRTKKDINIALETLNSSPKKTRAYGLKIDVSDSADCKKLINFSKKISKKIEVLINNAGIYGPVGKLEDINPTEWSKTIQVNLLGAVYCTQLVIPVMKKNKKGKIINLCGGGVGGQNTLPRFSAYFTSKISIAGLTEVVAEELKGSNIQVNCIAPGAVNSSLTDYLLGQGEKKVGKEIYLRSLKQKRSGGDSPLLAAELVSFLCSSKADHITGRLISAKWDSIDDLEHESKLSANKYKLRRIDNSTFYEK